MQTKLCIVVPRPYPQEGERVDTLQVACLVYANLTWQFRILAYQSDCRFAIGHVTYMYTLTSMHVTSYPTKI